MSVRPFQLMATALAAAVLLAACAAPASLSGPPTSSYGSAKSARAVADCLYGRWGATRVVGATAVPSQQLTPNGYRLSLTIGKAVDQVAVVETEGKGSTTRLWSLGMYFGDKAVQIVDVEACQ